MESFPEFIATSTQLALSLNMPIASKQMPPSTLAIPVDRCSTKTATSLGSTGVALLKNEGGSMLAWDTPFRSIKSSTLWAFYTVAAFWTMPHWEPPFPLTKTAMSLSLTFQNRLMPTDEVCGIAISCFLSVAEISPPSMDSKTC